MPRFGRSRGPSRDTGESPLGPGPPAVDPAHTQAGPGIAGLASRTLGNAFFGAVEFAAALVIALIASPYIVHGLGDETYGLLALVGVTIGALAFLDLGLGGAATRQIAFLHQRDDKAGMSAVVGTVTAFYLAVGLAGGALIVLLADVLVERLLTIPPEYMPIARSAFYVAAPAFAVSMLTGVLVAIPRAVQRYDVAAPAAVGLALSNVLVTVSLLALGRGLIAILVAGIVVNVASWPALYAVSRRLIPGLRIRPRFDPAVFRGLFSFGAFYLLSQLGVLVLYQADKLLIGSFLGVAAVTHYVVPGSIAQKIQGLVAAVTNVVFPVSSSLFSAGQLDALQKLYREGTRLVYILIAGLSVPLAILADRFLRHWMGPEIADASATPMVLLVATYALLSSCAIPWGTANGAGRASINAAFTAGIALINLGFFFVLVRPFGVSGAAAAYLISAVIGTPVLTAYLERRVVALSGYEFVRIFLRILPVSIIQGAVVFALRPLAVNLPATLALMLLGALLFPLLYWRLGLLQEGDRRLVSLAMERLRPAARWRGR